MIVMAIAIVAGVVVLFALFGLVNNSAPEIEKGPFREAWKKVVEKSSDVQTYEISIINADKLLDAALKKRRFRGETMGERLISAKNSLSKRQAVWDAHKLRNRIVHEENVRLDKQKVHAAIKGFESALRDLGAL